jgi:beta-galactosidase
MLGVCYYPEHWSPDLWQDDAKRMADLGLRYVRIGEFAWSAIEPSPGQFDWAWLDRAMETLGAAGLKVVLGTPTATPPKWLVDRYPEILPHDRHGRPRRFGSRRHYCFSSPVYRAETRRIVEAVARRYGQHHALSGWQTDNEYGCHDTVRSWSPAAAGAFRAWLAHRYQTPAALNEAWGNRFWSMAYRSFDEVDPPMMGVTELNPAHLLDFYRFSSDQVASYNALQAEILREHSPGRFITHNYMGAFPDFDHYQVSETIDFASWDSYPLGFTDSIAALGFSEAERLRYAHTGHPDISAFHHDLYRGMTSRRFWVMEQQPGPVNWAHWNPAPAEGMVRLWAWEALAHGAEVVSFFRWRQAPFAQEQMHAGLNRPDNVLDTGGLEAGTTAGELAQDWWQQAASVPMSPAPVALVFDYDTAWHHEIQPQGRSFSYLALVFLWYTALRRHGVDVDIVPPGRDLSAYKAVFVPSLQHVTPKARAAFEACGGRIVFGIRTGAKTSSFQIPRNLAPGPLQALLPIKVTRVESLRPGLERGLRWRNRSYACGTWVERLEIGADVHVQGSFSSGEPAIVESRGRTYIAVWPSRELALDIVSQTLAAAGVAVSLLDEDLRVRHRGGVTFAFNFSSDSKPAPAPATAAYVSGGKTIAPFNFAAWRA